ncbi:hypothetical protein E4U32_000945 [Claviceps aff. humidiphila group G2b]|nr:hypothetical protein E4U32_000945 [Claviceps aff. humidiphila group G2b]
MAPETLSTAKQGVWVFRVGMSVESLVLTEISDSFDLRFDNHVSLGPKGRKGDRGLYEFSTTHILLEDFELSCDNIRSKIVGTSDDIIYDVLQFPPGYPRLTLWPLRGHSGFSGR